MYSQRVRNEKQMRQLHLGTALHALDGRPVHAGCVRKALLGEVELQSAHADTVADGPAGVGDPLGLFGWHVVNRLRLMILSQQQN